MKNVLSTLLILVIIQVNGFCQAPSSFNHPGVLSSQTELDALKNAVSADNGDPRIAGYQKLANESLGDLNYQPTPYADVYVIGSGSCPEERAFRQDAHALYIQALKWVVTGNNAHRDKAIEIADAWANTYERIIPETNKPNQSTLEASWALPIWVAGAEILKYYNQGESGWSSPKFDDFVHGVLDYVNGGIYQTANWLISKDLALMSAGVFLNDKDLYNQGYNHVIGQIDDISVNGELPELHRDFVHSQYVLIGLTQCAEVAYQQDDAGLFTHSDARLRTGAEAYVQCVMGAIEPNYFSESDWARQSAPYELLLNRYTALEMDVPHVQNYIFNFNRVENGSEDHFVGWLSATHAIEVSGTVPTDEVPGNIAFQKEVLASSEPQPENMGAAAVDNNIYTRWSASGYPQSIEVDLGTVQSINKTEVLCYDNRAYQFKIEVRNSTLENYSLVVDRSENTSPGTSAAPIADEFSPVEARYVKLTITGASAYDGTWVSITEFRIYKADGTTTGINSNEFESKVYPNPVSDLLHISSKSLINNFVLTNVNGVNVLAKSSINALVTTVDLSTFKAGIYLYSVTGCDGKVKSGQLIIK